MLQIFETFVQNSQGFVERIRLCVRRPLRTFIRLNFLNMLKIFRRTTLIVTITNEYNHIQQFKTYFLRRITNRAIRRRWVVFVFE